MDDSLVFTTEPCGCDPLLAGIDMAALSKPSVLQTNYILLGSGQTLSDSFPDMRRTVPCSPLPETCLRRGVSSLCLRTKFFHHLALNRYPLLLIQQGVADTTWRVSYRRITSYSHSFTPTLLGRLSGIQVFFTHRATVIISLIKQS